jgi:hypothetical protein
MRVLACSYNLFMLFSPHSVSVSVVLAGQSKCSYLDLEDAQGLQLQFEACRSVYVHAHAMGAGQGASRASHA